MEHQIDMTKALAITTKTGELKLFKQKLELSLADETLTKLGESGVVICSAPGYNAQSEKLGLQTMNAPTVIIDGMPQMNPYVVKDERGQTTSVTCRTYTAGYTSLGVMIVTDRTVNYDLLAYKGTDLIKRCKKVPMVFKLAAAGEKAPEGWVTYYIDEAVCVHMKLDSKYALNFVSFHKEKTRKAVETCQTYGCRNSQKAHPCIKFHKLKEGEAKSSVVLDMLAWRPIEGNAQQWDLSAFSAHLNQIESVLSGEAEPGDIKADIKQEADQLHEDGTITDAEVLDEESQVEPEGEEPLEEVVERAVKEMNGVLNVGPDNEKRAALKSAIQEVCKCPWDSIELATLPPEAIMEIHKLAGLSS